MTLQKGPYRETGHIVGFLMRKIEMIDADWSISYYCVDANSLDKRARELFQEGDIAKGLINMYLNLGTATIRNL